MKYLIYTRDRWGVDTCNILICDTEGQADNLSTRYNKLKNRFNNLSESDVQYRKEELPKLSNDLRITSIELVGYLKYGWEMYSEEINCIKVKGVEEWYNMK